MEYISLKELADANRVKKNVDIKIEALIVLMKTYHISGEEKLEELMCQLSHEDIKTLASLAKKSHLEFGRILNLANNFHESIFINEDETELRYGGITYSAIALSKDDDLCDGCAFDENNQPLFCKNAKCCPDERKDRQYVSWKKKENVQPIFLNGGETEFTFDGDTYAAEISDGSVCDGCDFDCWSLNGFKCEAYERKDGQYVIWKKKISEQ